MEYNVILTQKIIANRQFGIRDIIDVKSIATYFYTQERLEQVVNALVNNKVLPGDEREGNNFREYLDVFKIRDSEEREFYVLVYDSDELYQDPEIVQIINKE